MIANEENRGFAAAVNQAVRATSGPYVLLLNPEVAEIRGEFESIEIVRGPSASTLYGRMARMGKADTQAHAGQLDAAIAAWKDLSATAGDDLPVDAILMELARAYVQKGNTEEARKTFTQIVDQHPGSPYLSEARAELENLKS